MSKGFRRPSLRNANLGIKESKDYPKKDLGMLVSFFKQIRKPSTDELVEQCLGEYNIINRLAYA